MITVRDLSVSYGAERVLAGLELELKEGGLYALLGPSGSGKSTLIKVLCGIITDYKGTIEYNGRPMGEKKLPVGYVPQNYGLLEWKTVRANIYLPQSISKNYSDSIPEIIKTLQIEDLLSKYPGELSGGQMQRVALARAFASKPELLLMDEPFSALDAFTSAACQKLFLKIWAEHKVTSLFITHNINDAVASAKTILLMDKTSGTITQIIENYAFDSGDEMARFRLSSEIMRVFEADL